MKLSWACSIGAIRHAIMSPCIGDVLPRWSSTFHNAHYQTAGERYEHLALAQMEKIYKPH